MNIKIAIKIIKIANVRFRNCTGKNLLMYVPTRIPTIEIPMKMLKNPQSILMCKASPIKNPISELMAIITKEVAEALFISNFATIINAGTIKKPPPAPTIPVNPPIKNP